MNVSYPRYYEQFQCLAGACPDSCCKEWAVAVDEDSAEYYRGLPGDLGDSLRASLRVEGGDTILALTPDRRCPMWRQDGLCRIQAELGEAALCHTCSQFPRLRHDYGDFAELGLELSCPEAARLILDCVHREPVTAELPGGDAPEYDTAAMELLLSSRESALALLEDPLYTPGQALAVLLLYSYSIQQTLDGGEGAVFSPLEDLCRARDLAYSGSEADLLSVFQTLEILTPQWRQRLSSPTGSPWSRAHRAMARYLVERYWLQAVSDLDLVCRVKFIITSCLAVKALGGDSLQTAQLYSKEIENDADNVEALLDAAYTSPALADVKLLDLLLR